MLVQNGTGPPSTAYAPTFIPTNYSILTATQSLGTAASPVSLPAGTIGPSH